MEQSMRAQLRQATVDAHERIECGLQYLVSPTLTRSSYGRLLEAFHGYYSPLDQRLTAAAERLAEPLRFWAIPSRTPLLALDLHRLGRDDRGISALPIAVAELPSIDSDANALGALYVVEGAALGGQVIWRAVAKTLGIRPATGCAFFYGRGTATCSRWRQFLTLLEGRPASEHAHIAGAARACFEGLEAWLRGRGCLA